MTLLVSHRKASEAVGVSKPVFSLGISPLSLSLALGSETKPASPGPKTLLSSGGRCYLCG